MARPHPDEARYGDRAHTILNNHRATMLLPGIKDPATPDHASRLIGEADIARPSTTFDAHGQRSISEGAEHRRLAPDHALRTLPDGHAVAIYGSLAPLLEAAAVVPRQGLVSARGRVREAAQCPAYL